MEVKKSSLIFFLYALVMFWPDYFFFGMIKYLENLLAAYAVIYVYNNRKRISGLSIIVIIYFTYFLLDTFLQGIIRSTTSVLLMPLLRRWCVSVVPTLLS